MYPCWNIFSWKYMNGTKHLNSSACRKFKLHYKVNVARLLPGQIIQSLRSDNQLSHTYSCNEPVYLKQPNGSTSIKYLWKREKRDACISFHSMPSFRKGAADETKKRSLNKALMKPDPLELKEKWTRPLQACSL